MSENRTPVSNAESYSEIGEYWDAHDLSGNEGHEVEFDVVLQSSRIYLPIDKLLEERVRSAATRHGVSVETLLNLWIQERISSEADGE